MKKFLSLIIVILILLSGCHVAAPQNSDDDPLATDMPQIQETAPMAEPEETVEVQSQETYDQQTMFAVSMPIIEQVSTAGDGTVIFTHSYQTMQLILQDPDVADSIIIDYLGRLDSVNSKAEEVSAAAETQYSAESNWTAFCYDAFYSPQRIDQAVLSLYGTESSYTGMDRRIPVAHSANYSLITGEVLTLGSILSHIDAKEKLISLVIEAADSIADETQLYDDYPDYITERFEVEESFDEDWFFTDNGLCFFFQAYDLAPYSSGIIKIEVPYAALTGIIADEYFPPETETFKGSVHRQLMEKINLEDYTQIAELVIDDSGAQYFIYAQGAVLDLTIEYGAWNDDGTAFIPTCTVFAAASLTPHDGIMIQTHIPESMPQLRVTYRSGSEVVTRFLGQNGQDGSIGIAE